MSNDFGNYFWSVIFMGRYYYDKKSVTEDTKTIQSWFLNKHGYFRNSLSGTITWTRGGIWGEHKSSVGIQSLMWPNQSEVRIHYTQTDRDSGDKKDFDYRIPLTTTPCNFGGVRYWFVCPWYKKGVYCGRRVGVLYKDSDYFACRHCYNLSYQSRNENRRSKWFYFGRILDADNKSEELRDQIKRPYYRGKPTKKQRRLDQIRDSPIDPEYFIRMRDWL